MLLRALLDSPELRLRLLVGEDALDRPVAGVYTTDLLDPRRYLSGGEIVLTGLMWRRTPADSESFVATLVACGAVALAAGDAALGSVPDDLVAACRRRGLPLFEVPVDVSFAAITEQVLTARLHLASGPGPAVTRLRLLAGAPAGAPRPGAAEPAAGLTAVFAVAGSDYGVTGWVLSAAGRLIAGVSPAPGAALRRALASAWLRVADRPVTVLAGAAPYSLWPVAGQPAHRLASWFVALTGDQAGWDTDRRMIAAELAGLAAGYRARHEEGRRGAQWSADSALRQVLDWQPGAGGEQEIAAALHRWGLPPSGSVVAVALTAGAAEPDQAESQVARVLVEELLPARAAAMTGAEAVALVPGGEDVVGRVREAAAALARVPGLDLALGVSVLAGDAGWTVGGIAGAVTRARQARRLAVLPGGGVRLVDAAQIGSVELLLSLLPAEAGQAFRDRLLDPLLAYDREHGTELVRTLEVFLGCSGSWTRAAEQMFVHVNSLRYRVRRIEELTGRDLSVLEDQAALLLALRLTQDQRADPAGGGGVQAGELPARQ